jgi:chaperonin GroES
MKLRQIGDKVVVKPNDSEETSAGGIILPDTAKKRPQEGTVVAVGPGKLLDDGARAKINVAVGDTVVYSKYGGTEVTVEGVEYTILEEDQIYAVKE